MECTAGTSPNTRFQQSDSYKWGGGWKGEEFLARDVIQEKENTNDFLLELKSSVINACNPPLA